MGSRERRQAERRKRKRRAAERETTAESQEIGSEGGAAATAGGAGDGAPTGDPESFAERMSRRAEARNEAARATLEPLEEGERPAAVTIGGAISGVLALIFTSSAVVAAVTSIEVRGEEPSPVPLVAFAAVLWMMSWGMFRARYWAVLGFQMLLVLFMLSAAVGLVGAETILQLVATLLLLAGAGALFYMLIRAMARIQMPDRPGR